MSFRYLVLGTAAVAALLIALMIATKPAPPPPPVSLSLASYPVIGVESASQELLMIEEPRCSACRAFFKNVYPKLYDNYISTGEAKLGLLVVSFYDGSRPMANAALWVAKSSPNQFFPFTKSLFDLKGKPSIDEIAAIAEKVGGIDVAGLTECVRQDCMGANIDANLESAKKIMGEGFGTPALYLNGSRVLPMSYSTISYRLNKAPAVQERGTP